mgnify:CR=1 FL=1
MNLNKRFLVLAFCSLALLSIVCLANVFAADEVTITGTVYAVAWDDDDNVTAATITAGTGEEYVVVANAAGKELFKLDLEVVTASGTIGEDGEGNKTITVTKYEIMPESE